MARSFQVVNGAGLSGVETGSKALVTTTRADLPARGYSYRRRAPVRVDETHPEPGEQPVLIHPWSLEFDAAINAGQQRSPERRLQGEGEARDRDRLQVRDGSRWQPGSVLAQHVGWLLEL